jgi:hypothetical protein
MRAHARIERRIKGMSRLTHYTRTREAVANILRHGFAWVPNKRRLIQKLVPHHDYSEREPQQFGMISFTDADVPSPRKHRETFGQFGIVVSPKWARLHRAQRVLYIAEDGPLFESFRSLFDSGYEQLHRGIRFPGDGAARMAFTNKNMASVQGGSLWSNLLTLYEYMEPVENAYQSEWRIVNPMPLYGYAHTTAEVIQEVSPPRNWAQHVSVLKFSGDAILGFVCPRGEETALNQVLPSAFQSKPLHLFDY